MTKIEWTEHTWNPVTGCTPVSAGCAHCYAATMTRRLAAMGQEKYTGLMGDKHFNGVARCHEDALEIPLRRRKPTMYFVNSMSDLFHEGVPFEFIDRVFAIMALCPQHTFQVLTKRPERMAEYFDDDATNDDCLAYKIGNAASDMLDGNWIWFEGKRFRTRIERVISLAFGFDPDDEECEALAEQEFLPLPNVWLGTSVEDQPTADERIPHLLRCPAAVRFLSCEPLLGAVDLDRWVFNRRKEVKHMMYGPCAMNEDQADSYVAKTVDWVIAGGESGPGARWCKLEWIAAIVGQCKAAGVPCFVKQLGANPWVGLGEVQLSHRKGNDPSEWPEALRVREMPLRMKGL